MSRRLIGAACVIAGAAGVIACVLAASTGMRDVMRTDGGFCASGGPYVIAHQCSGADVRLVLVGILGGLVGTAIMVTGSAFFGRGSSAGLVAWVALFGLLGWNFIDEVVHPATGQGSVGWLVSGAVFWLLAAGGLVLLVTGLVSDLRTAGRPDPVAASFQPLVRAQFMPTGWGGQPGSAAEGIANPGPGSVGWGSAAMPMAVGGPGLPAGPALAASVARSPSSARLGSWVVLIVLGGAIGLLVSSALISALR
jgi:hypothetical protein